MNEIRVLADHEVCDDRGANETMDDNVIKIKILNIDFDCCKESERNSGQDRTRNKYQGSDHNQIGVVS